MMNRWLPFSMATGSAIWKNHFPHEKITRTQTQDQQDHPPSPGFRGAGNFPSAQLFQPPRAQRAHHHWSGAAAVPPGRPPRVVRSEPQRGHRLCANHGIRIGLGWHLPGRTHRPDGALEKDGSHHHRRFWRPSGCNGVRYCPLHRHGGCVRHRQPTPPGGHLLWQVAIFWSAGGAGHHRHRVPAAHPRPRQGQQFIPHRRNQITHHPRSSG